MVNQKKSHFCNNPKNSQNPLFSLSFEIDVKISMCLASRYHNFNSNSKGEAY